MVCCKVSLTAEELLLGQTQGSPNPSYAPRGLSVMVLGRQASTG